MPLPTDPSTERLWLTALRAYLIAETAISWNDSPIPPTVPDTPVGGVWVANDFMPVRPNIIDDVTRDQLLAVSLQVHGTRASTTDLVSDWKTYLLSIFNTVRKNGITLTGTDRAFLGLKPYGMGSSNVICETKARAISGDAATGAGIVHYQLEFRYIYQLPGRLDC